MGVRRVYKAQDARIAMALLPEAFIQSRSTGTAADDDQVTAPPQSSGEPSGESASGEPATKARHNRRRQKIEDGPNRERTTRRSQRKEQRKDGRDCASLSHLRQFFPKGSGE